MADIRLDIAHSASDGLTWDNQIPDNLIPDNLRNVWVSNFEMMEEIERIKYSRAIVPHDAKNLNIVTLDAGDASSKLIYCAIYARFEKKRWFIFMSVGFLKVESPFGRYGNTSRCKHKCCYRMHCEEGIWESSKRALEPSDSMAVALLDRK